MEKAMNTNIRHYFNHLTCTIFLALGLLGLFATASLAARDTTAPTVSITSPTSGTIITSAKTVRIAASASDNVGISKVELYNGTTLLKNDTTSPYFVDWAITRANNGSHNLTAKAYDAAGNIKVSTAVAVTINIPAQDLTAPTVSITSPTSGTTLTSAQTVRISASASDNVGISKVELYNGTTLLKNDTTSPYFVDWAITRTNNGSHNLTAKAYDAAGNIKVSTAIAVSINIPAPDLTAPTVSLSSPATGTTFTSAQTVTIAASASDNVGISKVELYNGSTLMGTDTSAPYSFAWAISSANNGSYTLTVKGYDAAGNSKVSSAVTVTVNIPVQDLSAPTVSLTSPAAGTTFTTAQTVTIAANALDNVGVSKVELYNGTTLRGTDTTVPYSFAWAITSANNGNHNFTAKAYDAAGNVASSTAVGITVNIPVQDLSGPTVSLTSPAAGTTFTSAQTVRIAASATGSTGVSKVDFYNGATLLKNDTTSPYFVDWAITSANNGNHNLSAKVYDAAGNSKVSNILSVNVNISTVIAPSSGPLKVFPEAEGFGAQTQAGRGGVVIKVTNLNDSGAGSLRAALEATGPRIVVFETSGTIKISTDIRISNPYVTVAGQTAPSPGIMIMGYGLRITTHDVLIQHIAIRPGDEGKTSSAPAYDNVDCIQLLNGANNVVIDHVSMSWAIDETISTWPGASGSADNITLSHNIIAEGLQNSLHTEKPHSKGLLLGVGTRKVSVLNNLLAHNWDRNPQIQGPTQAQLVNNLFYEAGQWNFAILTDPYAGGAIKVSFMGNVFKDTTSTTATTVFGISSTVATGTQLYQSDSIWFNENETHKTVKVSDSKGGTIVSSPPIALTGLTIKPASEVKAAIIKNVGARPAQRDTTDTRILSQVQNGTGGQISSVYEVGRPSYPANYASFNAGSNPNGDDDGDGYTNIEEILHQMAAEVEGRSAI